mmetsp:Transcript_1990/g.2238  ORF Transcript_1990/g.2238 Transcript_1990/m.2238 type:complete len:209 (+) Transcript_1990:273-899(+)
MGYYFYGTIYMDDRSMLSLVPIFGLGGKRSRIQLRLRLFGTMCVDILFRIRIHGLIVAGNAFYSSAIGAYCNDTIDHTGRDDRTVLVIKISIRNSRRMDYGSNTCQPQRGFCVIHGILECSNLGRRVLITDCCLRRCVLHSTNDASCDALCFDLGLLCYRIGIIKTTRSNHRNLFGTNHPPHQSCRRNYRYGLILCCGPRTDSFPFLQ